MITLLITVRNHSHRPSVEQVEAQAAKVVREAQQLAGTIMVGTETITEEDPAQEVTKAGESSVAASSFTEEPSTDEAAAEVDAAMGVANEKKPVALNEAVEEPTAFGVDITTAESQEDMPLEVAEHEVVVGTTPLTGMPVTLMEEVGPSEIVASPVTETILEIMRVPCGKPHEIASSSDTISDSQYC